MSETVEREQKGREHASFTGGMHTRVRVRCGEATSRGFRSEFGIERSAPGKGADHVNGALRLICDSLFTHSGYSNTGGWRGGLTLWIGGLMLPHEGGQVIQRGTLTRGACCSHPRLFLSTLRKKGQVSTLARLDQTS